MVPNSPLTSKMRGKYEIDSCSKMREIDQLFAVAIFHVAFDWRLKIYRLDIFYVSMLSGLTISGRDTYVDWKPTALPFVATGSPWGRKPCKTCLPPQQVGWWRKRNKPGKFEWENSDDTNFSDHRDRTSSVIGQFRWITRYNPGHFNQLRLVFWLCFGSVSTTWHASKTFSGNEDFLAFPPCPYSVVEQSLFLSCIASPLPSMARLFTSTSSLQLTGGSSSWVSSISGPESRNTSFILRYVADTYLNAGLR